MTADFNRDGRIDQSDRAGLLSALGLQINRAPSLTLPTVPLQARVNLPLLIDGRQFAVDVENDPVGLRGVNVSQGNLRYLGDSLWALDVGVGYTGSASISLIAGDGLLETPQGSISVQVSAAGLQSIDFESNTISLKWVDNNAFALWDNRLPAKRTHWILAKFSIQSLPVRLWM